MIVPVCPRMRLPEQLRLTSAAVSTSRVKNSLHRSSCFTFSSLVPTLGWLRSLVEGKITWVVWDWVWTDLLLLLAV